MAEFQFQAITELIASRADELVVRTDVGEFTEESRDARLDELLVIQQRMVELGREYVADLTAEIGAGHG